MKKTKDRVAHFMRKDTQSKASFIRNQMVSHRNYEPSIIWKSTVSKLHDGGFAEFDFQPFHSLDLSRDQNIWSKLLNNGPRILTRKQINLITGMIRKQNINLCHFHFGTDCEGGKTLKRKKKFL